jgi:2,5-furandicarboxylate decarboxylase 1
MSSVKNENFRAFLERLRGAGELTDIKQPVDIRHIATLVDQARTALLFHDVMGYGMPVVSGIIRSRERAIMSMGCSAYAEIEQRLQHGIDHPIPPKYVETTPAKQVIETGDEVDLFRLPIPMSSIYDGGPMITAGVVIAKDPEFGFNSGMYRFMVKEKNLTGIDIVTPNNMRLFRSRSARTRSRSWARVFARRSAWTRWASPAASAAPRSSSQPARP